MCGWLPNINIWNIGSTFLYVLHIGCARSHILNGMRTCPSITIVRAWWYLGITCSVETPANRVSINVWWWSTLINQWRLVERLPSSKEYPASWKASGFTSMPPTSVVKRKQERDNQHFISLSDLASALRKEKQVPGVQKARVIWTWSSGADPAELCLYEKPQKVSFMITALGERRWGWVLWRPCQSAAVGSPQVLFHNNSLIQKADHIERLSPQIV